MRLPSLQAISFYYELENWKLAFVLLGVDIISLKLYLNLELWSSTSYLVTLKNYNLFFLRFFQNIVYNISHISKKTFQQYICYNFQMSGVEVCFNDYNLDIVDNLPLQARTNAT